MFDLHLGIWPRDLWTPASRNTLADVPGWKGLGMPGGNVRGRLPTGDEIRAAERGASRQLLEEFGLRLTREDFDAAYNADLAKGHVVETLPWPIPPDETQEQAIVRFFVRTQMDSGRVAMLVAERAIKDELASLPDWVEVAIRRVKARVRDKYNEGDIRGTALNQRTSVLWAGLRARAVLEPVRGQLQAIAAHAQEPEPGQEKTKAGHPAGRDALEYFGRRVIADVLDRPGGPRPQEWARVVGLLWVVSGGYTFTAGLSDLIDRAVRVARQDMKPFVEQRVGAGRDEPRRPALDPD